MNRNTVVAPKRLIRNQPWHLLNDRRVVFDAVGPKDFDSHAGTTENAVYTVEPKICSRPETRILPRREVMKPQCFDGKESVNSFLAHFENCARFNHWTEEDKCSWLQWSLKGKAQQVLWDLPQSYLTSFSSIVMALRERYGSEHQRELYRIELRNRRRGPRETLSDLMQDIRRLMVLAYTVTLSDMWESIAVNSFLEALGDPHLTLEIVKREPQHLRELTGMLCFWKVSLELRKQLNVMVIAMQDVEIK